MNTKTIQCDEQSGFRKSKVRLTDLITGVTLLAILFAHYFLPSVIDVLVPIGLINLLFGAQPRRQKSETKDLH